MWLKQISVGDKNECHKRPFAHGVFTFAFSFGLCESRCLSAVAEKLADHFLDVVSPLTDLISPSKPFVWSAACQTAFRSIKALLCSAPVLAAPDFGR